MACHTLPPFGMLQDVNMLLGVKMTLTMVNPNYPGVGEVCEGTGGWWVGGVGGMHRLITNLETYYLQHTSVLDIVFFK